MIRKATLFAAVLSAAIVLAPRSAQSQVYLGPEVAWSNDFDFGVGVGVEFGLPQLFTGANFMGDFLYFWEGDDFTYFEFNANLTYDLPLEDVPVVPFALAGVNIGRTSVDSDSELSGSNTDVGLNVGGGFKFHIGSFRPWIMGRVALGGTEAFTVTAFLPFRLQS